jgi:hypothetical protein
MTDLTLIVLVPVAVTSPWHHATAHGAEATSALDSYGQVVASEPAGAPDGESSVSPPAPSRSPQEQRASNQELIALLHSSAAEALSVIQLGPPDEPRPY